VGQRAGRARLARVLTQGHPLGAFLNGEGIRSPEARGERIVDASFLVLFNVHHEPLTFTMPEKTWGTRWLRTIDTADAVNEGEGVDAGKATTLDAHSVAVFRRPG
jgi:isoamylase